MSDIDRIIATARRDSRCVSGAETRALCDEIERLRALLDCRAGKLLRKGKYFLCVANDEPYFSHVYDLIRNHEMRITKRWSDEDEEIYRREIANWQWPKTEAAEVVGES